MADLSQLYNFTEAGDRLSSSGQPQASQFADIQEAGFEAVINLATSESENALANEAELVEQQGMDYVHIPVDWENPQKADFEQFVEAMDARSDKNVFVHCAANMRASAFTFLYRVIREGVDPSEAKSAMQEVWDPMGTWEELLDEILSEHDIDYFDID